MEVVCVPGHVDAGAVDDEGLVDGAVVEPGAAELVLLHAHRVVVALVVVRDVVLIPMDLERIALHSSRLMAIQI